MKTLFWTKSSTKWRGYWSASWTSCFLLCKSPPSWGECNNTKSTSNLGASLSFEIRAVYISASLSPETNSLWP